MSLSAVDVRFLTALTDRLAARRLAAYVPGSPRSAAAIVLRFGDSAQQSAVRRLLSSRARSDTPLELMRRLEPFADPSLASSLRVLFVRRARAPAELFGGVAFPGGRRNEDDADDTAALHRAVDEMIGVVLHSAEFVPLGRMRDVARRGAGTVQSRFVFLHTGELSPARLAWHEVGALQWTSIAAFEKDRATRVCVPLAAVSGASTGHPGLACLADLFPRAVLCFPGARERGQWDVWGRALRTTGELRVLGGLAPPSWPLVTANSAALQHLVIDATHGYYEALYVWHRARGGFTAARHEMLPLDADDILWAVPQHITPRHLFFLIVDACGVTLLVYGMASVLFTTGAAVRMAMGSAEADDTRDRIRAYHAANTVAGAERQRQRERDTLSRNSLSSDSGHDSDEDMSMAAMPSFLPLREEPAQSDAGEAEMKTSAVAAQDAKEWEAFRREVRSWATASEANGAISPSKSD